MQGNASSRVYGIVDRLTENTDWCGSRRQLSRRIADAIFTAVVSEAVKAPGILSPGFDERSLLQTLREREDFMRDFDIVDARGRTLVPDADLERLRQDGVVGDGGMIDEVRKQVVRIFVDAGFPADTKQLAERIGAVARERIENAVLSTVDDLRFAVVRDARAGRDSQSQAMIERRTIDSVLSDAVSATVGRHVNILEVRDAFKRAERELLSSFDATVPQRVRDARVRDLAAQQILGPSADDRKVTAVAEALRAIEGWDRDNAARSAGRSQEVETKSARAQGMRVNQRETTGRNGSWH